MGAGAHISPLAPASPAELPVVAGVTFATAAAGLRYKGRPDLMLALVEPGATIAGVFTRSRTRSAPVDWCRANLFRYCAGGHGAGDRGQCRQRQRLHRQGRHARREGHRDGRRTGRRLQAARGLCRVHGRDRRGPRSRPHRGGAARPGGGGTRRCRGRGGQGHHDHRHVSQDGVRHGAAGWKDRDAVRLCQGLGHDRARHGDDARLHLHRRRAAAGRPAKAAGPRRRAHLQLHHRRRRHLDQRHAAVRRHRRRRQPDGRA
jgi:hypothetical protein